MPVRRSTWSGTVGSLGWRGGRAGVERVGQGEQGARRRRRAGRAPTCGRSRAPPPTRGRMPSGRVAGRRAGSHRRAAGAGAGVGHVVPAGRPGPGEEGDEAHDVGHGIPRRGGRERARPRGSSCGRAPAPAVPEARRATEPRRGASTDASASSTPHRASSPLGVSPRPAPTRPLTAASSGATREGGRRQVAGEVAEHPRVGETGGIGRGRHPGRGTHARRPGESRGDDLVRAAARPARPRRRPRRPARRPSTDADEGTASRRPMGRCSASEASRASTRSWAPSST